MATQALQIGELTSLQNMPARIEAAARSYGQNYDRILNKPRLGMIQRGETIVRAEEQMRDELAQARADVLKTLAQLRTETAQLTSGAQAQIAAAMGRPAPKDATEALLRETREGRAWARLKPILDNSSKIDKAIRKVTSDALTNADDDALAALRAELPAYLEGIGQADGAELLDEVFDKVIAQARPAVAAALAAQEQLEDVTIALTQSFTLVESAIKQGEVMAMIVQVDGSMVDVDLTNGKDFSGSFGVRGLTSSGAPVFRL